MKKLAPSNKPFIIPIFIPHAGCPHRCIFCDQQRTTGTGAVLPTTDAIEKNIAQFLSYRKDPNRWTEISYYGGNFLGLPSNQIQELLRITTAHILSGAVDGIRFSTRPDTINSDRLDAIAAFPVTTIEIGAQSMDDRVLRLNGRGHSTRDTIQAVGLIRRRTACRLGLQMMIGLAGDSFASAVDSAEQLAALGPDFVRIYPTLVLKGSVLERWYAKGSYQPLTLEEAVTQTKALLQIFSALDIPVIRMGLQPTEELNSKVGVTAGPFHPAFGELVHAALWRDTLEDLVARCNSLNGHVTIKVNPRCLSQAKGQQNANIEYLDQRFSPLKIGIFADNAMPIDMVDIHSRHFPINTGIHHGHQSRTGKTPGSR